MKYIKKNSILSITNSYVVDSPQPINLSYQWNYGSLLAVCLIIQIISGVLLAMHYSPNINYAFSSVEHIMRDINNGWLIRYLHANTASFFFMFVYAHIGRGIYYGSYKSPRTLTWGIGVIIFLLMVITAFLGYVLPFGQMSLWGATVITNLLSAIPWLGKDLVEFIWGGFSVNNATLNRFFSLHYLFPFIIATLAMLHLIALHKHGSNNPLGISSNLDKISMHPYYIFKDLITIFIFLITLGYFLFINPNILGHPDNYIMANPMQTPASIVPEWYLLPFYAILRSIPNKLLGVIAMIIAILILLILPNLDKSNIRSCDFKLLTRTSLYIFFANFLLLLWLGSKHVELPYTILGIISTIIYFSFFLSLPKLSKIDKNYIFLDEKKK